ncbi:hypothetical protein QEJ31_04955 [Pigmentibacter sp. JX0631]|uniref:hypothetical protein n=1 Tax=Pigmentibacter sp. JX0631 TaxID=2976982 RepID=UPI0024691B3D|nr:hypothetical protein [Pigmentibacter sp. JX0631]WGL60945.1 hypothetical protein QEJ31_04955 [Pigmentibacter sp. JX0631]
MFNKVLVIASYFLFCSCSAKLFSNNDSTPSGFRKIDFSPKQNPTELIRDPLDQSNESLTSIDYIFDNYNKNLLRDVKIYIQLNSSLQNSYDENSITKTVNQLSPYLNTDVINKTIPLIDSNNFIFSASPMNTLNKNIVSDTYGIFYKFNSETIKKNNLEELYFIDDKGNTIEKEKYSTVFFVKNYYARNLNKSLIYPINSEIKNNWEIFIQCANGSFTDIQNNLTYLLPTWPRVIILQLNPNTKNTIKYSLHKNVIVKSDNSFVPTANIYQNTTRSFNFNDLSLPANSTLKNHIISIPVPSKKENTFNAIYSQEGMSKFYSRFSSNYINNFKNYSNFSSWQILINKSWIGFSQNLDTNYNTIEKPDKIVINYLNLKNLPVDQNYSKDFLPNGIHYVDTSDPNTILTNIPDKLSIDSNLINEELVLNFCKEQLL